MGAQSSACLAARAGLSGGFLSDNLVCARETVLRYRSFAQKKRADLDEADP